MLTRPEIAQLTALLHRTIDKMKPFANESPDMFQFRIKPWKDLLTKLNEMFERS